MPPTFQTVIPEAFIIRPDGRKLPIYFVCAGCGRSLIWTFEDGHCPKCYGDTFKIVGLESRPKKRCHFPWCGVDKLCVDCAQGHPPDGDGSAGGG